MSDFDQKAFLEAALAPWLTTQPAQRQFLGYGSFAVNGSASSGSIFYLPSCGVTLLRNGGYYGGGSFVSGNTLLITNLSHSNAWLAFGGDKDLSLNLGCIPTKAAVVGKGMMVRGFVTQPYDPKAFALIGEGTITPPPTTMTIANEVALEIDTTRTTWIAAILEGVGTGAINYRFDNRPIVAGTYPRAL